MKASLFAVVAVTLSTSAIGSPVIAGEIDGKAGMERQVSVLFRQMTLQAMSA